MHAQEQIQFIVENTDGECWHHWHRANIYSFNDKCCKCGQIKAGTVPRNNPSPHSLDDLYRLADKLDIDVRVEKIRPDYGVVKYEGLTRKRHKHVWLKQCVNNTRADALRDALVKAIEGSK